MAGPIWPRLVPRLHRARRTICEHLGIGWYSRTALDDLDRKLEPYLPRRGFFIEVGANDGMKFSNTYFLEKVRGWRGVLVEAMPGPAANCRARRRRSKTFHAALVPFGFTQPTLDFFWADEMSRVTQSFRDEADLAQFNQTVSQWHHVTKVTVPARTLTSILDEAGATQVDFFSLDVEGFELQVLQGLDFERYAPTVLLVECRTEPELDAMKQFLQDRYRFEKQMSHRDYLFLKR